MIYTYKIQHQDVDGNRRLRLNLLENYLLNACGQHADSMGVGYHYLLQQNKAWVLVHFSVEMDYIPTVDDIIEVDTWMCGFSHMLSPRSWVIRCDGKEIGRANSVWTVIDLTTREMVNVFDQEAFSHAEIKPELPLKTRSRVPLLTPDSAYKIAPDAKLQSTTHEVVYSDIDYNGHCNSCRYVEIMLNALSGFPKGFTRMDVTYQKEAHMGEVLTIRWLRIESGILFNIVDSNNNMLVTARF